MFKLLLLISTYFLSVHCNGQFTILHSPKSLEFKNANQLNTESINDVFGVALGYPIEHSSDWQGLYVRDPFNVARSVLTIYVDGIEKLLQNPKTNEQSHSYDLIGSTISESLDTIALAVEDHNDETIDFDLNQGLDFEQYTTILGDIKFDEEKSVGHLKPQLYAEDKLFLEQISIINALSDSLSTLETLPTLLTVRLSLNSLIAAHKTPEALTDALKLLNLAIENLTKSTKKVYQDNVLIGILTDKETIVNRPKRAATAADAKQAELDEHNISVAYNADYPVIFNIILWFGVVMVFTLIAISYAIATMDPGRDSVIYRMTSARMKKEN